jgi:uncharacterized membrane protein YqaE (UPF0057 family)
MMTKYGAKIINYSRFGPGSRNENMLYFCAMSFWRVLLSLLFPPLAVVDKGCGSFIIVCILTICGWVPGVIAALIILNNPNR